MLVRRYECVNRLLKEYSAIEPNIAKKGVIYKESKSVKISLGKIMGLKRQIKEKNYTIEYIKVQASLLIAMYQIIFC